MVVPFSTYALKLNFISSYKCEGIGEGDSEWYGNSEEIVIM